MNRRTYRALLYLLTAVALAAVAFALLLAGWLAALLLAITPASVPVLVGFRRSVRGLALVEAWLARELLGSDVRLAPVPWRGRGFWAAGKAVLGDPAFWRQQAFLVLRMLVGSTLAIGEFSLVAVGGGLAALQLYYRHWTATSGSRRSIR